MLFELEQVQTQIALEALDWRAGTVSESNERSERHVLETVGDRHQRRHCEISES
jgi:hypothetical protein